jgi:hypothetical protein
VPEHGSYAPVPQEEGLVKRRSSRRAVRRVVEPPNVRFHLHSGDDLRIECSRPCAISFRTLAEFENERESARFGEAAAEHQFGATATGHWYIVLDRVGLTISWAVTRFPSRIVERGIQDFGGQQSALAAGTDLSRS